MAKIYYDKDADALPPEGADRRGDRLRQPGARPRPEPPRQRGLGRRRPPRHVGLGRARAGRGAHGRVRRRGGAAGRHGHDPDAGHGAEEALRGGHRPSHEEGEDAPLRPRLQHPVLPDRPATRRGRRDDRPQGPRPPGPGAVQGRRRDAGASRRRPERERSRAGGRAGLLRRRSAAPAPGSSRRPSPRRRRRICSASRPSFAAAPPPS